MGSNFFFAQSTFDLFNYGAVAPLPLLNTCRFFSRNFTFDFQILIVYYTRKCEIQVLFNVYEQFSSTFQDCPSFSSTFQACANPVNISVALATNQIERFGLK